MRCDRLSGTFDFGPEPELPLARKPARNPHSGLISVANGEVYTGYRRTMSDGKHFIKSEDSDWPLAQFETSSGLVQVQLRPERDEPLLPEEQDEIAAELFERAKEFSDIGADVCDILMSNWLKDAKGPNHRAEIRTDDLCRRRFLKAKLGGSGTRGGYTPVQGLIHLNAARSIFESWIAAPEATVYARGKRPARLLVESRPFVITDRIGENRFSWTDSSCHKNCLDVLGFKYVAGEIFGSYLLINRQTALLSERALKYNLHKELWEKRLTRYYSYLWRCRAREGDFSNPLKISTIFSEGLRQPIDYRRLSRTVEHFVKSHRTLQRDGVIEGFRYDRQSGLWADWTVTIDPPLEILRCYADMTNRSLRR
jgi:hypothetical protein